jgi:hypothetical protein
MLVIPKQPAMERPTLSITERDFSPNFKSPDTAVTVLSANRETKEIETELLSADSHAL